MNYIDLRSDTVTQPTPEMREAMAKAEVGDDVYDEDPTINRLQELAAEKMGKQAGLFVHEAGGMSALGGIHSNQLINQPDGALLLEDLAAAIRPDDQHEPVTRLICLENTHNGCGGVYQTPEYMHNAAEFAHSHGLSVHLDGARIFNAAVAQSVKALDLAGPVDSVTFCLSKGLCAPVGSVLCGSQPFIAKAHRLRKMLGGGMRQAGILAAAGLVALESMVDRLGQDHIRARNLANGLRQVSGLTLDPGTPATNMVFLSLRPQVQCTTGELIEKLSQQGVLIGATGDRQYRLVTHYWIDDAGVDQTIAAFRSALG